MQQTDLSPQLNRRITLQFAYLSDFDPRRVSEYMDSIRNAPENPNSLEQGSAPGIIMPGNSFSRNGTSFQELRSIEDVIREMESNEHLSASLKVGLMQMALSSFIGSNGLSYGIQKHITSFDDVCEADEKALKELSKQLKVLASTEDTMRAMSENTSVNADNMIRGVLHDLIENALGGESSLNLNFLIAQKKGMDTQDLIRNYVPYPKVRAFLKKLTQEAELPILALQMASAPMATVGFKSARDIDLSAESAPGPRFLN